MKAEAAGSSGGICISCSAMGIGFGFNNPNFSDRLLKVQVTQDSSDSQNSNGSSSSSAPSCRVTTVHISSLVLGSQSPFFYKMFSNGMKESEQQTVTIPVKASEGLAMLDLLEYMYNHKLKAEAPAELLKVLVLADRYQVAACVMFCAQALSSFPMTFELALSCLNLPSTIYEGDDTHLSSLIETVKCFLSKNFSTHYEEALDLPLESIEKILSWDTLEVDSEDEVYDFLLKWMRAHYKDISERRQVFSSSLSQLVRFPHMSCEKLKIVLHSEELETGDATKMVVEALLSMFGNNLTHVHAKSATVQGRVYKLRPVEVIVLDRPTQECIVYSKLTKRDCHMIEKNSVGICTQKFHVGNESFYLEYKLRPKNEPHERLFSISIWRCKSKSTNDALKLDLEVAVTLKTTGKFTVQWTTSGTLEGGGGWYFSIGKSWDSLMVEDGEYFDNGVLYCRLTITLKQ